MFYSWHSMFGVVVVCVLQSIELHCRTGGICRYVFGCAIFGRIHFSIVSRWHMFHDTNTHTHTGYSLYDFCFISWLLEVGFVSGSANTEIGAFANPKKNSAVEEIPKFHRSECMTRKNETSKSIGFESTAAYNAKYSTMDLRINMYKGHSTHAQITQPTDIVVAFRFVCNAHWNVFFHVRMDSYFVDFLTVLFGWLIVKVWISFVC